MTEGIAAKIPRKVSEDLFCIYIDYEKDHTKPYTTFLGCRVENLESITEEMVGKTIETATFKQFIAKGNLAKGIVYTKWLEIWNSDLNRSFIADFEVYGEKTQNPENAEVEIFIGIQ
jgi:predicted transcriptional regulator YdeE